MKKIIAFLSTIFLASPVLAFAKQEFEKIPENTLTGPQDVVDKIANIGDWLFTILLVLAVIFIVLAAYKYLMSGGGEEVGKAHKMLAYAAVAVAVAFLAKGIVSVTKKLVGEKPTTSSETQSGGTNNGGSTGGSQLPNAPRFSQINMPGFTDFFVEAEICNDNKIPGVQVTKESTQSFTTHEDSIGNPEIPSKYTDSKGVSKNPEPNAGQFARVGQIFTGIFPFRTEYVFDVEKCNDGITPILQVDKDKNGSWTRVN